MFLHHLSVKNNSSLLSGNRAVVGRIFLQGLCVKSQIKEHVILFLGALQIEGTHGHQVSLDIRPFCQQFASQLRGAKGLE